MDLTSIHSPTPNEIDVQIRAARKARALAMREFVRAARHWLAHPRFGHRTA